MKTKYYVVEPFGDQTSPFAQALDYVFVCFKGQNYVNKESWFSVKGIKKQVVFTDKDLVGSNWTYGNYTYYLFKLPENYQPDWSIREITHIAIPSTKVYKITITPEDTKDYTEILEILRRATA